MGHDQRQGIRVRRPHVYEVDVDPVDLGFELRQRIEFRLALAPVVTRRPVVGELLDRHRLHALRSILDELRSRPTRRSDASTQVLEFPFRSLNREGPDPGRSLAALRS